MPHSYPPQHLKRKAEERNPDEFYFAMEKARTKNGVQNGRCVCVCVCVCVCMCAQGVHRHIMQSRVGSGALLLAAQLHQSTHLCTPILHAHCDTPPHRLCPLLPISCPLVG